MLARILAASVAGGVAFFVAGFVIYGLLLDPMVMKPNLNIYPDLMNETPLFVPLVLANIVNGFLLAYIFEKWASIKTFAGGAKGGAIIMFIIALMMQMMFMAFMNLSKNFIPPVADVIGSAVMGAIGGGVVGMVLGLMNKDAA
ncbi:MAG: hypothetical protein WBO10_13560 [Pyrinomonadaceae bacterium]